MKEVIIHVGLHKTGTTFLQKEIFCNIKNVNFLPLSEHYFYRLLSWKLDDKKINILSNESFSGIPYAIVNKVDTRFIIADRLKTMFPNAKIIIGTREQVSWLKSLYKQSVKSGNYLHFDDWLKLINREYCDFDKYVNYLKNIFDDVYRYDMDYFKSNPKNVVKEICEFMGAEIPRYENKVYNPSINKRKLKLIRFLNKFSYSKYFVKQKKAYQFPMSFYKIINYLEK